RFLNELQAKVGGEQKDKFRNANGVYMKLMNFRRFDPDYHGKGLERGGKDEEVVWNLYANKPGELSKVATSIRSFVALTEKLPASGDADNIEEVEGEEGKLLTRVHRIRERDTKLVQKKKAHVLRQNGRLTCEACGFDFAEEYGDRGDGFIECHHKLAVSELTVGQKTKLTDLALVCSNCHRMIHRKRPWLQLDDLCKMLMLKRG
ncbi:MAG: HNH endonuclease, partial [Alphaproteobacteria bacterium]|nr:HNH endonuclease [Alphaproteobacteria bacterium]